MRYSSPLRATTPMRIVAIRVCSVIAPPTSSWVATTVATAEEMFPTHVDPVLPGRRGEIDVARGGDEVEGRGDVEQEQLDEEHREDDRLRPLRARPRHEHEPEQHERDRAAHDEKELPLPRPVPHLVQEETENRIVEEVPDVEREVHPADVLRVEPHDVGVELHV